MRASGLKKRPSSCYSVRLCLGKKGENVSGVQTLLRGRGLLLVGDYGRFLRPLGMGAVESRTAEQRGTVYPAFEAWIGPAPIDR